MIEDKKFYNSILGETTFTNIVQCIRNFIQQDRHAIYRLVIGTDSHEKTEIDTGKKNLHLVTAIVIYRQGFGGRYFWKKKELTSVHSLREKIYAETIESLDFAREFIPKIQEALHKENLSYNVEIHVDVGEVGATREMIKEIVGMVQGMGYTARTKPDSFAASYVADRHA